MPSRLAKMTAIALAALAATLAIVPADAANLVANGSFESTSLAGKGLFVNNVAGWSGGSRLTFLDYPGTADDGSYLSVYGPFPATSPDGGKFVEADGDPHYSSAIWQTISGLSAGKSYTLSFYQAAGQQLGFTGPTTEQWIVGFGSDTQRSSLYSLPQGGVGPWQLQTMNFVATASSQVLSFLAKGTPNGAPPISFLDGVTLQETAVPEPGTLGLLSAGIVGFVALRRKRGLTSA